MNQVLKTKPTMLRTPVARGISGGVDREGGDDGAGIIKRVSIATRGEAVSHDFWVDRAFLKQIVDGVNEMGERGIKSRFTHPSLSSDGMGKFLGRFKNAKDVKDQAFADLHISPSAHETPDGDLASYVMKLAEDEPDMFGTSIVFRHDEQAEAEVFEEDKRSPDKKNVDNLPHARLGRLHASDVVDDPAANPDGLFHRGAEIAQDAEALLSYSLGLTTERPEMCELEIDPDRISQFVHRFLESHGLELVRKTSRPDAEVEVRQRVLRAYTEELERTEKRIEQLEAR